MIPWEIRKLLRRETYSEKELLVSCRCQTQTEDIQFFLLGYSISAHYSILYFPLQELIEHCPYVYPLQTLCLKIYRLFIPDRCFYFTVATSTVSPGQILFSISSVPQVEIICYDFKVIIVSVCR